MWLCNLRLIFLPHSAVISDLWPWFPTMWWWFPKFLWSYHREKNIVEEIELIMGARVEQSSSSWVCIPQKSLAITRDFWNTNSLRWTPFQPGTHDGFFMSCNQHWFINSLWPRDAIWRQRSGSTLAQVMAWCLVAPSHSLNQCWLIINEIQWHSY